MLIFRVERKDDPRCGVFVGWNSPARQACYVAREVGVIPPDYHPEPMDEGLMFDRLRHHCGVPHLDAYRTWFAHERVRATLYEDGTCHMRVYDVPDHLVLKGMLQVMFDPDEATSVRLATPEEYQ